FEISVIVSLPFLTQVIQVLGPGIIDRVGSRKRLTAHCMLYSRLIWLLIALLPLLVIWDKDPVLLFIVLAIVSLLFFNLAQNSWLTWMADLVPPKLRGRFFSRRNMYIGALSTVLLIGAGFMLDFLKSKYMEGFGYTLFILIAVIFGMFSFYYMSRMEDVPMVSNSRITLRELFQEIRINRQLRSILVFLSAWTLVTAVAAPFYYVHLYEHLHWDYSSAAIYASITAGLPLLLQPFWGKILDRVGHKPILRIGITAAAFIPIIWILMAEPWSYVLWFEAVVTGFVWAGINIAVFNIVLYALPGAKKSPVLAIFSSVTGVLNFIGMVGGGFLVSLFLNTHFSIGSWNFSPFHIPMLLSVIGRFSVIPLVKNIEEPEAQPTSVIAQIISTGIMKRVNLGRQFWVLRESDPEQE
ncbi:MAG: MFS transporter, partial [Candidatus Marinimicrobia bacterium]|nr:MFS transporter [Candidatus Neomarinimicrobiota bacterium]